MNPGPKRPSGISFPLFLAAVFALFVAVSAGALVAYYSLTDRAQAERTLGHTADVTIVRLLDHVDDYMGVADNKLSDLQSWLSRDQGVLGDDARMTVLLRGALAGPSQVVAVAFVHVDGRSWRMARDEFVLKRDDLMRRPDVRTLIAAARQGKFVPANLWTPPITDSVLGVPIVVGRRPVRRGERIVGVMFAAVSLKRLSSYLANVSRRIGRTVFILADRERVLAHPLMVRRRFRRDLPRIASLGDRRLTRIWQADQPMIGQRWARSATGRWLWDPDSGDAWVYVFAEMRKYGGRWTVGYHYTPTWEQNPLRDFWIGLAIGGVLLVVFAIAGALLGRRLSRPIRRLADAMGQIGTTPSESLPRLGGSRITEFDRSSDAFNRMASTLRQFERYAPREVVRRLVASGETIGLTRHEVTILFADLDGFSGMAENWTPEETGEFLGSYLGWLTQTIESHGGTVDKFMGDGVMAFWGAPETRPDHAAAALSAARAFRDTIAQIDGPEVDGPGVSIRVGIHTGNALAGEVGAESRTGYTLIGDAVNVAARLQDVAKAFEHRPADRRVRIAISGETLAAAGHGDDAIAIGSQQVRGRRAPVLVYRC